LDSVTAQSEVWYQQTAQQLAESKRTMTSHFGWSLVSVRIRTQWKFQRKTNPILVAQRNTDNVEGRFR